MRSEIDNFPDVISDLIKERYTESLERMGKEIGIAKSQLSEYQSGTKKPNARNIVALADYFGVSTDYLLGRTRTRSISPTVRAAVELTGLNERSVVALSTTHNDKKGIERKRVLDILIENPDVLDALYLYFDLHIDSVANIQKDKSGKLYTSNEVNKVAVFIDSSEGKGVSVPVKMLREVAFDGVRQRFSEIRMAWQKKKQDEMNNTKRKETGNGKY